MTPAMSPAIASGRLALYLAATWNVSEGERITSAELARATGVNATQVRRDLSQVLGRLGTRGVGYRAAELSRELERTVAPHAATLHVVAAAARDRANQLERVVAHLGHQTAEKG